MRKRFYKWLEGIKKRIRRSKKYIFLVMSPHHIGLQSINLNRLLKSVRGIILMTYDYSINQGKQGPNAPMEWLTNVIETVDKNVAAKYASRVMIGLNFYGYRFDGTPQGVEAVIGTQIVELLKKEGDQWEWQWDKDSMEHVLVNKDDASKKIYYPTLMSVAMRIEMVSIYKFGISIWELGQGMEYFTDLL